MAAPCVSPCGWGVTEADLTEECKGDATEQQIEDSIGFATDILFELSGRRFAGSCSDRVRPCAQYQGEDVPDWRRYDYESWNKSWGYCSCNQDYSCGCNSIPAIQLGNYPVTLIEEVKIDGAGLPINSYRIDNYRWLVRLDGEGWPCCQSILKDSSEVGTFEVLYTYGQPPPISGKMAVIEFACDVLTGINGGECKLPSNLTSLSRQGTAQSFMEPFQVIDLFRGRGGPPAVGLPLCDQFLSAYNKNGIQGRARAIGPNKKQVRRVGT